MVTKTIDKHRVTDWICFHEIDKIVQVVTRRLHGIEYEIRAVDVKGEECLMWQEYVQFGRGRFAAGGDAFVTVAREQDRLAAEMARKHCRL